MSANPIPFDERVDREYDRYKDGDEHDYSSFYTVDTDCGNCNHDWHKGERCHCGCTNFVLREDA